MRATTTEKISLERLAEHVGLQFGISSWIELGQARIDEFARCTGDHQWIHVDQERAAREGPFGGTVAHGFLTLALLAPTCFEVLLARVEAKQALSYGLERVRFLAPVRAGKRLRNRLKVIALEDKGGGRFLVTTDNTLEIFDEPKPALVATALVLLTG
jgi:acyl dehydratase